MTLSITDGEGGDTARAKLNSLFAATPLSAQSDSTTNFVFEGDSLTADDSSLHLDWPALLMGMSQFSGRGTKVNVAGPGRPLIAGVDTNYTGAVYPYRPTGAITTAFLFLLIGTNDLPTATTASAFNDAWDDYVDGALADGFQLIAFTIPPRPGASGYTDEEVDAKRLAINDHIRKDTRWKYLAEYEAMIPNQGDSYWWNMDRIHPSNASHEKLAHYINNSFAAGGALNLPVSGPPVVVGTGSSSVPSNALLTETPREFAAAQGFSAALLTDASSIVWDLDDAQSAYVILGGNRTLANPSNARAGFSYLLEVRSGTGSHTLAYGANYRWPAGSAPTISTGADKSDLLRFVFDGNYMLGSVVGQNYDIYVPPNIVLQELFADTGADQACAGTPPDTINLPGHNWTSYGSTLTRIHAGAYGVFSPSSTTPIAVDTGLGDGTLEMTVIASAGMACGPWFRGSGGSDGFMTLVSDNGDITIYKKISGGFSGVSIGLINVTLTPVTGNVLQVVFSGPNIEWFMDGVSFLAIVDSFNETATEVGIVCVNGSGAVIKDFSFASP